MLHMKANYTETLNFFHTSKQYKNFIQFVKTKLDVNISCLGINFNKDRILSIKKYYSYNNNAELKEFLRIPFLNKLYENKNNNKCINSSPSIALKYYPCNDSFTKYFHIKFNEHYVKRNKKFFQPKYNSLNLNSLTKAGISIESNKLIKYFYFNFYKEIMPLLNKKFKIIDFTPHKIEYVEYSNKFKFILDEDTCIDAFNINEETKQLISFIEDTYNLQFKTGGKDSEGVTSLYFF